MRLHSFSSLVPTTTSLAVALFTLDARAAVTEPNGTAVPTASMTDAISLQAYFTSQNETINAITEAAAEPGAFSPLCDFTATLVLKQSGASCGIAWYNTTAGAVGPVPANQVYIIANPA